MREDHLRHDWLIPLDTRAVLDIGCGRGGNAAWLHHKGIVVDAISCQLDELRAASPFCRRVIGWDLNHGLPDLGNESYEGVICSHVFEHIAYPEKLLRDLKRVLVPNGFLLVVIPNLLFWSDRIKLLRGKWEYQPSGTFDYTHLRWYTAASMNRLLADHGLMPDAFIAEGWIPLPGLRFVIGTKLRARLNRIACRARPGLFGRQLIFRFRKPPEGLTWEAASELSANAVPAFNFPSPELMLPLLPRRETYEPLSLRGPLLDCLLQ
ncbi:MAG TPA: class I SAM-dependent methyltransferase [Candidatus Binatia bacterium]